MAWVTPRTWTSGAVSAADMNELRDSLQWLKDADTVHGITSDSTPQPLLSARYGVSVSISGDSFASGTDYAALFVNVDEWDDDDFHDTGVNPRRIVIPVDGNYVLDGWFEYEANATGNRQMWFEKNGATEYNHVRVANSGSAAATSLFTSIKLPLLKDDYIQLYGRQSSGGSLDYEARLQVHRYAV